MHQHRSLLTTNNLDLKYIYTKSSKHLLHHFNIHSCRMYKKLESFSPFYNPIEAPETQIRHSDLCLGVGSSSPRELLSAAWIFACIV